MTDQQPRRRRGAGRPPRPVLDRGKIAAAALSLVDEGGLQALTMARLARRLGVAASALYNHVDGRAELELIIQDAIMSRVDVAPMEALAAGELGAGEALRRWGRSYRSVVSRHPDLVPFIATVPVASAPLTLRMYEAVAAGLRAAGVPEDRVVPVIVAFESFLFGSAIDVHAPATIFQSAPGDPVPAFQGSLAAFTRRVDADAAAARDDAPGAGPVAKHDGGAAPDDAHDPRDAEAPANPYADEPFEWGLDALVARVEALIRR
ncbi:TetR/AcrR family transcriptional regulator [Corynebacterium sp. 335C]